MKVIIDGTPTELCELYRTFAERDRSNGGTVQERNDDVPNRDREEGANW